MLKEFKLDLHIHTCLSPCGDLEMLPPALVKRARSKDLEAIGICDHNSVENALIVQKVGAEEGIVVFTGMEITSSEEVHLLAFFDDKRALYKMQDIVYENLSGENDENFFGKQIVVDDHGKGAGCNSRLLIGTTALSVEEIVRLAHDLGGIVIASHIDKQAFSIISQLGFIPKKLQLDALELSVNYNPGKLEDYKNYGLPLIKSSDAHFLADVGRAHTKFLLETLSFPELKMALGSIGGRRVVF